MKFRPSAKLTLTVLIVFLLTATGFTGYKFFMGVASPYGARESVNWLIKSVIGPVGKASGEVRYIPNSFILNEGVKAVYTLVFVGDIMPSYAHDVEISGDVLDFIRSGDYLIANLEGVILDRAGKKDFFSVSAEWHNKKIIDTLSSLFPPERTFISMANNHAGDFGSGDFFNAVKMLEERKFNVFGWNERPFFDINNDIRIVSGTMWSNRKRDYVFDLKYSAGEIRPDAFNILYPHFGYELELSPRCEITTLAENLILKFGAIIGHHSHSPQPVSAKKVSGVNKLIAYSLGDFSGYLTTEKYQYGIIIKASLGKNENGRWLIGNVEWRFTRCNPDRDGRAGSKINFAPAPFPL